MRLLMTAGLLALPASALAINTEPAGFYAGAGISQIDFSGKAAASLKEKPDWTAVELSGGYKHSPYAGLEARIGAGSSPDLFYSSLYYRTESANDTAKTYLLLGYSAAKIGTNSKDISLSGFSYGAGLGFPVGKNFNFNLEYRLLLDDSDKDVSLNALTASLDYRFSGTDLGLSGFGGAQPGNQGFYAGLGVAKLDLNIDEPSYEEDSDVGGDIDEELDGEGDIEEGGEWDPSWNAIELIGGYSHAPLATVELRLGTTDSEGQGFFEQTITYFSVYYRPHVDLGKAQLYGLLGYSSLNIKSEETDEESGEVFKEDDKFSGFSYGVGGAYSVTENINIGLEYRLLMRDDLDLDDEEDPVDYEETWELTALSASVSYRF